MERRGPSHSGPYGLACTSCFKSKCKCVARPDGDGCQRCHRLNKQCRPSDLLRRSTVEKKQSSTARIAELENKLSDLISQLQARNVINGDGPQRQNSGSVLLGGQPPLASQPSGTTSVRSNMDTADNEAQDSDNTDGENDDDGIARFGPWNGTPAAVAMSEPAGLHVSDVEGETLLSTFRERMLPHFAFVCFPRSLTQHQLRRDRPLLFRAIVCAAWPSARDKAARSRELKRLIREAMPGQEGQPNVNRTDLLLALLTYISWGWDHVLDNGSLSWLMLQAKSLAIEMRLDGPAPPEARVMALFTPGFDCPSEKTAATTRQDFLERQRAVLGCFVLSSAISAYYGQDDALRWTPQMEDGLAAISTNKDCPTDTAFAIQVRLQLLAQKSVQIHQQQQLEHGQAAATDMTTFPALMALTTLQRQLQELELSLPPTLAQQELITAHIHSTELSIGEATHAVNSMVPIMVSQFARMTGAAAMGANSGTTTTASSRQERIQCLWQCVRAVQACTSDLLAAPPAEFRGISLLQWTQLAQCVVALNRLTRTMDEPAWDRAAARAVIDLPVLVGCVAAKLELVAQAAGEQERDGVFTRLARGMREFCAAADAGAGHEEGAEVEEEDPWPPAPRPRSHGGMMPLVGGAVDDSASWLDQHLGGT